MYRYMRGVYLLFRSINLMSLERKRFAMRPLARRTWNSIFVADTDGSSNYDSTDMFTASMKQLGSLSVSTLRTQLKRCTLHVAQLWALSRQNRSGRTNFGRTVCQNWSPGPLLLSKSVLPDQFWQPKLVRPIKYKSGTIHSCC